METATNKEKFEILYKRLENFHNSSIDVVFKAMAAILLVNGWLITSDKARLTLEGNRAARYAAVIVVVLYAVLFGIAAWRTTEQSTRLARQLDELAYMPRTFYAGTIIDIGVSVPYVVMNLAVCIAVITLIVGS